MVFGIRKTTALTVPLMLALAACGGAEQADLPGGGGGGGVTPSS